MSVNFKMSLVSPILQKKELENSNFALTFWGRNFSFFWGELKKPKCPFEINTSWSVFPRLGTFLYAPPVPNLRKTLRLPQNDLIPWTLTLLVFLLYKFI